MQTSGWEGPFFIQMHYSPLQGCRGTLEKSYIFISFANPRSLTRVRLRSSRQRQEMAELWCTTAINVSQEGRHARWEEEKKLWLLEMPFGNKTFTSPITSWLYVIHQLAQCINTVQAHIMTVSVCFCFIPRQPSSESLAGPSICFFYFYFLCTSHSVSVKSTWTSWSGRDFSYLSLQQVKTESIRRSICQGAGPTLSTNTGSHLMRWRCSHCDWLIRYSFEPAFRWAQSLVKKRKKKRPANIQFPVERKKLAVRCGEKKLISLKTKRLLSVRS